MQVVCRREKSCILVNQQPSRRKRSEMTVIDSEETAQRAVKGHEILAMAKPTLVALENLGSPDPRRYYTPVSDADMGWFVRTGGLRLLGVSSGLRGVSVCLDQEENGGFAAEWNGPRKTFRLEVCPAKKAASWVAYYLDDDRCEEGGISVPHGSKNAWQDIVAKIEMFFAEAV